uniref:Uncharacterized protein n=1 Tax=Gopherus agassizii TaxID=38772 RepID=A0A452GIW3_9SAUR
QQHPPAQHTGGSWEQQSQRQLQRGGGAGLLTVSHPELPFDWLLSPMSGGVVTREAGPECWTLSLSGAGDLRGGGCVFHQGRGGSAGPHSESPLQRCHAGEL